MTGRNHRKRSIFTRLFIPIFIVLMLQSGLYIIVFNLMGLESRSTANAYDILNERVLNRSIYIENEMIHRWSNITSVSASILNSMEGTLNARQAQWADIHADADLNEALIESAVDDVIYLLRRNNVTGAFLILDGPRVNGTGSQSRPGIYIRDMDPSTVSDDNADLLIERGSSSISKERHISLDSSWSIGFDFSDAGDGDAEAFFFNPLRAAQKASVQDRLSDIANYGYWSGAFSLSPSDTEIMTYSMPLVTGEGEVVGVIGIDLTQRYILSMLNYDEIMDDKKGAYCIAVTEDDGTNYDVIFSNGPYFKAQFGTERTLTATGSPYDNIITLQATGSLDSGDICASVQRFHLYNSNTPFEKQQWVLIGTAPSKDLLQFPRQIRLVLYMSAAVCMAVGILIVLIVSRRITKPIADLVGRLERSNPNKPISLAPINIHEIDQLSSAVESLSSAVAESASKISKIITMSKISIGVFEFRENDNQIFCSDGFFSLLDFPFAEGTNYIDREELESRYPSLTKPGQEEQHGLFQVEKEDGTHWVQYTYVRDGDRTLGTVQDITKDMLEKQKIEYERDYDLLTNLYNRRGFEERIRNLFQRPEELGTAAMVMWDLDNLKYINDTYGHDCGDIYIIALADALRYFDFSHCVAARRSGDEFYTFLYGFPDQDAIRESLQGAWTAMARAHALLPGGQSIPIRVSAGVAWYPKDASTYESLIRYADFAMYSIKHTGKGCIQEFDQRNFDENFFLLSGLDALNHLIDQELVTFALQPIVEVKTGTIYGYEMLMRSLVEEFKSPLDILRIARSQSKLGQIEKLTLFKAMEMYKRLLEEHRVGGHVRVFINSIGGCILSDEDLTDFVARYGPLMGQMVLEVTENVQINREFALQKKDIVKRYGGMIAMDDFGAGYNSESELISLLPDIVKVDISLVRGIDADLNKQDVVAALIAYSHERGIQVLGEGVETAAEMEMLVSMGMDFLQGYFLEKPTFDLKPLAEDKVEHVLQVYRRRMESEL